MRRASRISGLTYWQDLFHVFSAPLARRTVFRLDRVDLVMKDSALVSALAMWQLLKASQKFYTRKHQNPCHTVYRCAFYFALFLIQFTFMLLNSKKRWPI